MKQPSSRLSVQGQVILQFFWTKAHVDLTKEGQLLGPYLEVQDELVLDIPVGTPRHTEHPDRVATTAAAAASIVSGSAHLCKMMMNGMGTPSHMPAQTWSSRPQQSMGGPSTYDAFEAGRQHTQQPIVTGTSILGIRYKDGIMMAADTLASYGSLARFMDVRRLKDIGSNTLIGASGDMSDFQFVQHELQKVMIRESNAADGHALTPSQLYAYLSRVMYQRRSKVDPLWNSYIVGGVDQKTGEPFLGYVDLLGTTYESTTIATGFGLHLAQPLLRKAVEGKEHDLDEATAREILQSCMKVLFYRDARSLNRYQIARINKEGIEISEPMSSETSWGFAEGLRGYGPQTQ